MGQPLQNCLYNRSRNCFKNIYLILGRGRLKENVTVDENMIPSSKGQTGVSEAQRKVWEGERIWHYDKQKWCLQKLRSMTE